VDLREVERFPADYDYRARLSALEEVGVFEGGVVYSATEDGYPITVTDESTLSEMLGPDEADIPLITVRRFRTVVERDAWVSALNSRSAAEGHQPADAGSYLPSQDAASVTLLREPLSAFKKRARATQGAFRSTLSQAARSPSDAPWSQNEFLLALGCEDENLYPSLCGPDGARDYFAARGAKWWWSPSTGDSMRLPHQARRFDGDPAGRVPEGPTRNLTSSQIACVNLLLPWKDEPEVLATLLRAIDPEVATVAPLEYEGPGGRRISSNVEFEWTGRASTLEGSGSRGAHATSADACLIGVTAAGVRRAFLFEFKYTESYRVGESKAVGSKGAIRLARYTKRYTRPSSSFSGAVPITELLYEPLYQILRLILLGDAMVEDPGLALQEVRVITVCPEGNIAYRNVITSPPLSTRFLEEKTLAGVVKRLMKRPHAFSMVDPTELVNAMRVAFPSNGALARWSRYVQQRYDW